MNETGNKYYENKDGGNLKEPVKTAKKGSAAFNRKVSFANRFGGMDGDMEKLNSKPSRLALALKHGALAVKNPQGNLLLITNKLLHNLDTIWTQFCMGTYGIKLTYMP